MSDDESVLMQYLCQHAPKIDITDRNGDFHQYGVDHFIFRTLEGGAYTKQY